MPCRYVYSLADLASAVIPTLFVSHAAFKFVCLSVCRLVCLSGMCIFCAISFKCMLAWLRNVNIAILVSHVSWNVLTSSTLLAQPCICTIALNGHAHILHLHSQFLRCCALLQVKISLKHAYHEMFPCQVAPCKVERELSTKLTRTIPGTTSRTVVSPQLTDLPH